eukprot:3480922-Alexandrium_andersonii.AAC.1
MSTWWAWSPVPRKAAAEHLRSTCRQALVMSRSGGMPGRPDSARGSAELTAWLGTWIAPLSMRPYWVATASSRASRPN